MRLQKPHPTTFDKVRITRQGDHASIEYLEPGVASVSFSPVTPDQSNEDIFNRFNNGLLAMEAHRLRNPFFAREIPVGEPQIKFSARNGQWSAVGDVVRGVIDSDDQGEVTVEVDGHDLSLADFGSLLSVHMGWGVRLVFVPDDEINLIPTIKVGRESWGWKDEGDEPKPASFTGDWRISEMELWKQDDVEFLGPAYFRFDGHGSGSFRFVAIEGALDCRFEEKDGRPCIHFSWLGEDAGEPGNGRGWAILREDGTLDGRFYIHQGDDSSFKARKSPSPLRSKSGPPVRRRRP